MIPLLFLTTYSSLSMMAVYLVFKMIGNALVMTPLTTEALNVLPDNLLKHGTAMVNTLRQVGVQLVQVSWLRFKHFSVHTQSSLVPVHFSLELL
ncbi:hypothetical protein [Lactobacillus sp. UCMA15818]|uniref:hypothetical protein n=1 Tax=Lactobacillus sp. UCMA15818 TaxID=2583394 RepID=UPI0025B2171C|nr:hypothetical protein [Lactobacillus sp. UCMA15818]MDN2453263.1 multidrug efflux MFS transporter [Lactobacillus sp. UCMA15818]